MPSIAEIRAQYPQYEDVEDEKLLQGLHKKFYSDMEYADFRGKIEGATTPEASVEDTRPIEEQAVDFVEQVGKNTVGVLGGIGHGLIKFGQGATQSIYMAGEAAGLLPEGSSQRLTEAYVAQNKQFDKDMAEFLGVDQENPSFKAIKGAEFAGEALPLMAVPGSSAAATLPARVAQESAVGGALGHALFQEDVDAKNSAAAITAALSATIPVAGAAVRGAISYSRTKQIDKVAEKAREYIGEGVQPTIALRKAMYEVRPSVGAIEQAAAKGVKPDLSASAVQATMERKALREGTYYGQLKTLVSDKSKPITKGLEKVLTPIASRMERMGLPRIASTLRAHDMDTAILIQKRLDVKDAFRSASKNLSGNDVNKFKKYLLNGDTKNLNILIAKQPKAVAEKLSESVFRVRNMLDDMHAQAEAQGIKVGYLTDFFPREIKDFKKFAAKNGIPPTRINEALARAINHKHNLTGENAFTARELSKHNIRDYLTEDEIGAALVRDAFKGKPETTINAVTQHQYSRTREVLSDEDILDYADLDDSLTSYILSMTNRTQTRKFFGGKDLEKYGTIKENEKVGAAVDAFVNDLVRTGKALSDDVEDVKSMLAARFVEGSRSPSPFIRGLKNITYSATLGNPLAAATQLGDMGAAAYLNGVARAVANVPKALLRTKGRVSIEDMGLNPLAHELEHLGGTAKILHWSLRASGFNAVDRLGKETILNSTLSKLKKQASTLKGQREILNKYKDTFTAAEKGNLIRALRAGNKEAREVKLAMWTELSKVQPISMSEMPEMYLRHPDGRIFYMLKTFTLKQLDLLRREAYDQIKRGKVVDGSKNLLRLGAIIGVANGGVEQAKSFVTGEDVDFSDQFFANILRNYAMSEYTLNIIKQGRPAEAVVRMMTPPVRVVEDPIRDLVEGFENMRTLKDLPPYGKALHYLLVDKD